jgi:hypothetical protein
LLPSTDTESAVLALLALDELDRPSPAAYDIETSSVPALVTQLQLVHLASSAAQFTDPRAVSIGAAAAAEKKMKRRARFFIKSRARIPGIDVRFVRDKESRAEVAGMKQHNVLVEGHTLSRYL